MFKDNLKKLPPRLPPLLDRNGHRRGSTPVIDGIHLLPYQYQPSIDMSRRGSMPVVNTLLPPIFDEYGNSTVLRRVSMPAQYFNMDPTTKLRRGSKPVLAPINTIRRGSMPVLDSYKTSTKRRKQTSLSMIIDDEDECGEFRPTSETSNEKRKNSRRKISMRRNSIKSTTNHPGDMELPPLSCKRGSLVLVPVELSNEESKSWAIDLARHLESVIETDSHDEREQIDYKANHDKNFRKKKKIENTARLKKESSRVSPHVLQDDVRDDIKGPNFSVFESGQNIGDNRNRDRDRKPTLPVPKFSITQESSQQEIKRQNTSRQKNNANGTTSSQKSPNKNNSSKKPKRQGTQNSKKVHPRTSYRMKSEKQRTTNI